MTTSRIGTLALQIRAGKADSVIATRCTELTRRVLDRVIDLLDCGDRVVLIRKLEIRWRLPEQMLETEDTIARLVSDLLAALEPAFTAPLESLQPDANAVVFPDTATWWADALEARADRRVAWYHEPVLDPEPLSMLAEPAHKTLALAVLRHLGSRATIVLQGSPPDVLDALADTLHVRVSKLLASVETYRKHSAVSIDPELTMLLQQVRAASGPNPGAALLGLSALASRLARIPVTASFETEALKSAEAISFAAYKSLTTAFVVDVGSDSATVDASRLQSTSYAGLFYLATLLVELETGEHLWKACLPEGQLLGWAATGLVGDDPVIRWFGGLEVSMPEVTAAQAEEVIANGCTALARRLLRHQSDELPHLELALTGQELVATLPHSVFPVWSAPCAERSELREITAILAECWPGGLAVPVAWDGLGLRGRIQVLPEHAPRAWFELAGPAPAARLATVAIGTAAALFEWRVGEVPQDSAAAFVERFLRLDGWLEDKGDELMVHLRATDVSFPVRRAGLDRDPGYIPWLGRTIVLHFEGDEPEGDRLPIISAGGST